MKNEKFNKTENTQSMIWTMWFFSMLMSSFPIFLTFMLFGSLLGYLFCVIFLLVVGLIFLIPNSMKVSNNFKFSLLSIAAILHCLPPFIFNEILSSVTVMAIWCVLAGIIFFTVGMFAHINKKYL